MSHATIDIETAVQSVVKENNASGVNLVDVTNQYKADTSDLVTLAQSIEKAYGDINLCAVSKLHVIQQQMCNLRKEAETVLIEAKINSVLHSLSCNFQKRPGHVYHVYEKSNGQKYFSMISPQEWVTPPNTFIGSFKLEADSSWTTCYVEDNDIVKRLLKMDNIPPLEYS